MSDRTGRGGAAGPAPTGADGTQKLAGIAGCVFDAYGTLFDVHAPAARLRAELGERADRLSALWRAKQLEYTWLRSLMGRHADFLKVTEEALDFAAAETGAPLAAELRQRLLDDYLTLPAWPDAAPALDRLRAAGLCTVILSNGTPSMVTAACCRSGLADRLDAVLSVEKAGTFKPAPIVYKLAVDYLLQPPQRLCFVSANGWDVAGAANAGLRAVWLNRAGRTRERLPTGPEAEIAGLDALPALLGIG